MMLHPIYVDDSAYKLKKTIESLRKEMIQVGMKEGLISAKTIEISQKLDLFIVQSQTSAH